MKFTGENLKLVQECVNLALAEIKNQIGVCPDVVGYAEDIEELEALCRKYEKLRARINKKLEN